MTRPGRRSAAKRRTQQGLALGLALIAFSVPVLAQPRDEAPSADAPAQTAEQAKAQQHFQRAKELYSAGSYREAVAELESARALDPKAKDLVFNLGIVHEKLGKFDEAISDFTTYLEMEGVTAQERQKAESIIKRIEGAKREVPTTPTATATSTGEPPPPPPREETPQRGRIDAATIAAGSVAVVGLGAGTFFGIRALTTRPDGFVTGRDGSYATLQDRTDEAHTSAIIADVALGVGVVAALATAWLYFGRTKDARPSGSASSVRVSAAPAPSGGFFFVGGPIP